MTTILGSVLSSALWLHCISKKSRFIHQWNTSISNDKKRSSAISVVEDCSKACVGHHSEKHHDRQDQTLWENEISFVQNLCCRTSWIFFDKKKHREHSPVYFKTLFKVPLPQAGALTPSLLRPLASESSLSTLLLVSVDPAFFLFWLSVKTWREEEWLLV